MKKLFVFAIGALFSLTAFAQQTLTVLGRLTYNTSCAGVWHYSDSLGNEYALVGAGDRVSIVDITNPAAPVEVFSVMAAPSLWREVKTWQGYAFSTTEGGGGLTIIDLRNLPASINSKVWNGDAAIAGQYSSSHTLRIDDGYMYLFGSNLGNGGALICDLIDPWNPHYVGQYNLNYIHDGYVRNDTLYAGEIYAGQFSVVDVTNKTSPVLLATQQTPANFNHNTWLSDNGKFLFTSDEVGGAPVGAFDISDLSNIKLVDTYYSVTMPAAEAHNVYVHNDFLICPSYGSHITIADASRPHNIIETANYGPTAGFLCWDADPYTVSGNILATDVDSGLFIFAPSYVNACFLEGRVTDSISGNPIFQATVQIVPAGVSVSTDFAGQYATGTPNAGTYNIVVSKSGYITKTIAGVVLANGVLTNLDVLLVPFNVNGSVLDASTGSGIPFAYVHFENATDTITLTANNSGNFLITNIASGTYEITAGFWGYVSKCTTLFVNGSSPVIIQLDHGIYDDFTFNFGWTIASNVSSGAWTRGEPMGTFFGATPANPELDVSNDCASLCYMTGNGGGGPNDNDVDNGVTTLMSPVFDVTTYADPYVNYSRWFFIQPGSNFTWHDTMYVYINNGTNTVLLDTATVGSAGNSSWVEKGYRISDFVTPTAAMQLIISISDKAGTNNPLEGGLDRFIVSEGPLSVNNVFYSHGFSVFPNPASESISIQIGNGFLNDALHNLSLHDIHGKTVLNIPLEKTRETISLSALPNGVYFLRLHSGNKISKTVKVVKL